MIGITLQFVAMLYMAGFLLANSNVEDLDSQPAPIKRAATGAIVMIYLSGFGWAMVSAASSPLSMYWLFIPL